ncbi:hypothetical protein [Myxosarcina sp. GI1]|uniref:hypothetical protein n=1 Tax=Myxosarcina sp. GI1 TaxID=1541065 RepID=UPI000560D9E4|nr:hypothetical protein [Myxosarcina sp. GI1]
MQELKITMLGASGVGKTTLLTAMYEQFESNIGNTNLQLTPDDESAVLLQERLIELKELLDVFEARGQIGITPTDRIRSFTFGLGKKGTAPSLQLCFHDYNGEYHNANASKDDKESVKKLLMESTAVLIPIDAPSLMEKNGKFHERINRPQLIKDLFKIAYRELDSPRLVIFAPVKCEKYLVNSKTAKELLEKVKSGYAPLLDYFNSLGSDPGVASVITPVQTVGSVVFSRIEVDSKNNPHFYFRKIRHDAEYSPIDSEQPLRYILSFLLKLHLESRQWQFFNFIRDWLKLDTHLKKAVNEFADGCKTNGNFTVLKGEKWLNI